MHRKHTILMLGVLALLGPRLPIGHSLKAQESQVPQGQQRRTEALPAKDVSDQNPEDISRLIEQLGDAQFRRREAARWGLARIGLAAYEQLRDAAERHPNIEIANAARYILNSQQVQWFLETDSAEVREILNLYQDLSEPERLSRVALLVQSASPDAAMALCRIARYEQDLPAKFAALGLIDLLSNVGEEEAAAFRRSIRLAVGDNNRSSLRWVRRALEDAEAGVEIEVWKALAQEEIDRPIPADDRGERRQLAIELCTRVSIWIDQCSGDPELAIEFARPLLNIVPDSTYDLQRFCASLLDELEAPRLVTYLSEVFPGKFGKDPTLMFFVAESHRAVGEEERASELAQAASEVLGNPAQEIVNISADSSLKLEEMVAGNRFAAARRLALRGLFDWAEVEYSKSIEFESRYYKHVRKDFARFLYEGSQFRKAADVMLPAIEESLDGLEAATQSDQYEASRYFFYEGLALLEEGKPQEAWDALENALKLDPTDPDILISMQRAAPFARRETAFESAFEKLANELRQEIVSTEDKLARSPNRDQRHTHERTLALACNQLAWLLANCQVNSDEAIMLSQRSLELVPDSALYLDTLGRAYFSSGNVENALAAQRRAVEQKPHDQQMLRQLAEFEASAAAQ